MHFTLDEIRELRERLPLDIPSVVDSFSSTSSTDALSARRGYLLDSRLSAVENHISAIAQLTTIYLWENSPSMASMVSAPDDTPRTITNARTVYEILQRTNTLDTRLTTLEGIVSSWSGGSGGGGGDGTLVTLANNTSYWTLGVGNPATSVSFYSKSQVDALISGATPAPSGGWIGSTQVQTSQNVGQALTGIGNATMSGTLSVGSTASITGKTTVQNILELTGTSKRIYFGDSTASGTPYIELETDSLDSTKKYFHFSHGLYSESFVSAGGVGSSGGGGGGGTGNDPNAVHFTVQSLTSAQQAQARNNIGLPSTLSSGFLKYTTGTGWSFSTPTIHELAGITGSGSGYLKYENNAWTLASGSSIVDTDTWRNVIVNGTEVLDSISVSPLSFSSDFYWDNSSRVVCLNGGSSYTLPTATATRLGGIKVGSGLGIVDGELYVAKASTQVVGGIRVGTGLSIDQYGILSVTGGDTYTLPIAGSDRLGGIKVGSGLSIDQSTGVLSLQTAGQNTLGGIKVGTGLSISSGVLSATVVTLGTPSNNKALLTVGSNSETVLLDGWAPDLSNYVTLTTTQDNISGAKTFTNSNGIGIGSSSHTLKYNSSSNRFEFNGNLYVNGYILAPGAIAAGA